MVESLPTQFGKYQLIQQLACGGMAEVFLALLRGDRGFEKTLVIKRILPSYGKNPLFIEMFTDVRADPMHGRCYRALGIAWAKVGDPQTASEYYKMYLKVMPDAPDADKVREILEQHEKR